MRTNKRCSSPSRNSKGLRRSVPETRDKDQTFFFFLISQICLRL